MKRYLFFLALLAPWGVNAISPGSRIADMEMDQARLPVGLFNPTSNVPSEPFIAPIEPEDEPREETVIITPILPSDTEPSTSPLPPPQRIFTLKEAIADTLRYQDDIKISQLEVAREVGVAESAGGPFDPVLDADITRIRTRDVQSLTIGRKTDLGASELIANVNARKKTRLGTLFNLDMHNDRAHNPLFPLEGFAPSTRTDTEFISFTIEQPLLRDFWYGTDRMTEISDYLEIRALAFDNLGNIALRLRDTVVQYWEWVAAIKLLAIRQNAEGRFIELVNSTKELIRKNQLAANDINQPLAQLATQKINTIAARQNLYNAFQTLKFDMGIAEIAFCEDLEDWGSDDFPVADFNPDDLACLMEGLLDYALRWRYEILASLTREQSTSALLTGAKNSALPKLNLFGGAKTSNFTLGDRADGLYSANSAREPQTDWSVGIRFSMPFYDDAALGLVRQLQAQLSQVRLRTQLQTQSTIRDVQEALMNQYTLFLSLKEAKLAVERNEILVKNEKEKLQGGFSTIFFLVDFENRLTDAEAEYIDIYKQYMQNIARLRYFTATLVVAQPDLVSIRVEDVATLPNLSP